MVDLALLQSVSYIAGALGVCIAAVYYTVNMRTTIQTRQAQLFMPLFTHMYTETFVHDLRTVLTRQWSSFDDYVEKYGETWEKEESEPLWRVFIYFEGIGVLVKNKLINPRLIDDQFSSSLISVWEKYEPFIKEVQKRRDWPEFGEWTEMLYDRVKPIREAQRNKRVAKGE